MSRRAGSSESDDDVVGPFVVEGRAFVGRLDAPVRNEYRREVVDTLCLARKLAHSWAASGYATWVYDNGKAPTIPSTSPLRLLEALDPPTGRAAGDRPR